MITDVRNVEVFENGKLANEDYHKMKGISSSGLCYFNDYCPAKYRYGEREETAALHFGIASHAALLEPELFDAQFVRDIGPDDHEGMLTSASAVTKELKARGVKVKSGLKAEEVYKLAEECDEDIKVLANMQAELRKQRPDSTFVKAEDYDMILAMRRVLFNTPYLNELLSGSFVETSVVCEIKVDGWDGWIKVKVRPDIITKSCLVPDYKTTRDVRPGEFLRLAYNGGYWFRQTFVCDILSAVYGNEFKPALIAQEKDAPYIPQLYNMDDRDYLSSSREAWVNAIVDYAWCLKNDKWPAYSDGPLSLGVPAWAK